MADSSANSRQGGADDLLVEQFRRGDRSAFDKLYESYKARIFNFVYRMVGDRASAEDLTQDVFIRAYMNISSYDPRGVFKAWLYTIASNAARNELKRRSRRLTVSIFSAGKDDDDDGIELIDHLPGPDMSPAKIAEDSELKAQIESSIQSLPPDYKEALILCVIEGFSYEEAAQALKTNVKTVSSRIARARKLFIKKINLLRKA